MVVGGSILSIIMTYVSDECEPETMALELERHNATAVILARTSNHGGLGLYAYAGRDIVSLCFR